MTVPAVEGPSAAELDNSSTLIDVPVDQDVVVGPQQRSRPTFSAIMRDAKKDLPSMARSDSEGHEDDGISPITPVRISVLEPTQPLQESEPEQVPDIKIGRDCHEEEDLEAYMDRAAEGFKRHDSWSEAVVAMAIKMQGGAQDSATGEEPGTKPAPSNDLQVQNQGHRPPSFEDSSQVTTASGTDNAAEQDHEHARAAALLRTVAAGPLPAAESLWSDDEECDH